MRLSFQPPRVATTHAPRLQVPWPESYLADNVVGLPPGARRMSRPSHVVVRYCLSPLAIRRLRPSEPVIGPAEGGTRWTAFGEARVVAPCDSLSQSGAKA